MMNPKGIVCPKCGQDDRVEKVSTLYLSGIEAGRLSWLAKSGGAVQAPVRPLLAEIPIRELRLLSRMLAPPSSGKSQTVRPVHPDLVVLAFSGVLPVFLAGIAADQRGLLIPILAVILLFYGLYGFRRKSLIARFEREKEARQEEARRIQRAIGRWMNLYYCTDDEGVFEYGKDNWTPVDRMVELLLS
jgi:hypothetical protein